MSTAHGGWHGLAPCAGAGQGAHRAYAAWSGESAALHTRARQGRHIPCAAMWEAKGKGWWVAQQATWKPQALWQLGLDSHGNFPSVSRPGETTGACGTTSDFTLQGCFWPVSHEDSNLSHFQPPATVTGCSSWTRRFRILWTGAVVAGLAGHCVFGCSWWKCFHVLPGVYRARLGMQPVAKKAGLAGPGHQGLASRARPKWK